jgi:hypothetical protein
VSAILRGEGARVMSFVLFAALVVLGVMVLIVAVYLLVRRWL